MRELCARELWRSVVCERVVCVCMCVCLYMCILPMLIRTEGVGLRLENRREKGKNKKQRTKMHFVSDYVV